MFQFKQFTVAQDQCAMKVCTDSCILGAYTTVSASEEVLDIGTGTGLLSLMLAQKNKIKIDAVEIDEAAAHQASQNVSRSPFKKQISVFHSDIQSFAEKSYDLIISNPPFYFNQLASADTKKNRAKHSESLHPKDLVNQITARLKQTGRCVILLPPVEMKFFEELMSQSKLFPEQKLGIRHSPDKEISREITTFVFTQNKLKRSELSIYQDNKQTYSHDFETLLKDYYIIF